MEELQTYYQIPSIAHFCNLFRQYIDLPDFDYEDLEFAFVSFVSSNDLDLDSIETNLVFRLICALLKGYFNTNINHTNWETYLQKLFKIQWIDIEKRRSPFVKLDEKGEEVALKFSDLPLRTKLDVIHCLCDYRLYADDISQLVNEINGADYRLEPLGTDSKGYIYWYFYGTRLYRENPTIAQNIESDYKKYDELVAKRAEEVKREFDLEKQRAEQELKKQALLEARLKKEAEKRNRSLPPKVLGFRTGLRQRKSEPSAPNGVISSKVSDKSASIVDSTKKCENKDKTSLRDIKEVIYSIRERQEAWSLVCQTEQDWKDLCLKFAKSKTKCEQEFYLDLTDFVPKICEIYENQEKERQRIERQKLLELLPRRLSSRIELKKIQKEKDDLEEQQTSRRKQDESDRKNVDIERERSQRIRHEREQRALKRLQMVEERADRAVKRQYLETYGEEMDTDSQTTDHNYNSNYNSNSNSNSNSNESQMNYITEECIDETPAVPTNTIELLYEGLEKVICKVKANRDAWPFMEPVDGTKFPMYYQVIEEPIDLSLIEKRIQNREYEEFEEVESDFKLMVNNCERFNGPQNGYTLMAYAVWRAFKKSSLKHLERELSYDESTAFLYPQKVTNKDTKPAIEAKKKKNRNKRRSSFKALDVLAEAAEKAVEANESRITDNTADTGFVDIVPKPMIQLNNTKSSVVGSDSQVNSVQIHGDVLANFLANYSAKPNVITSETNTASATIPSTHENLTFKSLDDWSNSIKQSGNCVVLPQNAVILSPQQFTHCANSPTVRPQIQLKVVSTGSNANTNPNTVFVNSNIQTGNQFTTSVISNNENASKGLAITDPKKLVIKLSRCEQSAGQVWKPVTIINSSVAANHLNTNNIIQTTTSLMNGQTVTTTNIEQFQGLRPFPTNCIPVNKRFVIQDNNNIKTISDQNSVALTVPTNSSPVMTNLKPIPQTFITIPQMTGIQTNQTSNLKVYRLQTVEQQSPNGLPANQSPIKALLMPFDKSTPNGLS